MHKFNKTQNLSPTFKNNSPYRSNSYHSKSPPHTYHRSTLHQQQSLHLQIILKQYRQNLQNKLNTHCLLFQSSLNMQCLKHNNDLTLYNNKTNQSLCINCYTTNIVTKHNNNKNIQPLQQSLQYITNILQQRHPKIIEQLQSLTQIQSTLYQGYEEQRKQFIKYYQQIEELQQQIMKKIEGYFSEEKNVMKKQLEIEKKKHQRVIKEIAMLRRVVIDYYGDNTRGNEEKQKDQMNQRGGHQQLQLQNVNNAHSDKSKNNKKKKYHLLYLSNQNHKYFGDSYENIINNQKAIRQILQQQLYKHAIQSQLYTTLNFSSHKLQWGLNKHQNKIHEIANKITAKIMKLLQQIDRYVSKQSKRI